MEYVAGHKKTETIIFSRNRKVKDEQKLHSNITNASTSLIPLYFVSVRRNLTARKYVNHRKIPIKVNVFCRQEWCLNLMPILVTFLGFWAKNQGGGGWWSNS